MTERQAADPHIAIDPPPPPTATPSSSSGAGLADRNGPAPEVDHVAPPPAIDGPSPLGYITQNGRAIGRITAEFNKSRGVRCYMHKKCTLAISIRKMPSDADIVRWLQAAELPLPTGSETVQAQKRDRHMAALRALRDAPR